jgi:hypothetical protein
MSKGRMLAPSAIAEQKVLPRTTRYPPPAKKSRPEGLMKLPVTPYPIRQAIQPRFDESAQKHGTHRLLVNKRRNRHAGA